MPFVLDIGTSDSGVLVGVNVDFPSVLLHVEPAAGGVAAAVALFLDALGHLFLLL